MDELRTLAQYGPSGVAIGVLIFSAFFFKEMNKANSKLVETNAGIAKANAQKDLRHTKALDNLSVVIEENTRYLKLRNGTMEDIVKKNTEAICRVEKKIRDK